ncbi:hypothetical protein REPUB_Repub12eG0129700 [Reevesia pubescens]
MTSSATILNTSIGNLKVRDLFRKIWGYAAAFACSFATGTAVFSSSTMKQSTVFGCLRSAAVVLVLVDTCD